jgi:apolipoprotein N-acyltransferase
VGFLFNSLIVCYYIFRTTTYKPASLFLSFPIYLSLFFVFLFFFFWFCFFFFLYSRSEKNHYFFFLVMEALSPITSTGNSIFRPTMHSSDTSFPIIAIAVIGILATAFLLVSYYVFLIKCCLSWHRIDLLLWFSLSRRREETLMVYSLGIETRGLDESVIRSIPIMQFKKEGNRDFGERSFYTVGSFFRWMDGWTARFW